MGSCERAGVPGLGGGCRERAEKRAKIETMYRDYKKDFADVQDIAPVAAMELLKSSPAVFVDVREEKEQAVVHAARCDHRTRVLEPP